MSIVCSAAHSNIISDSLITPTKNASVFFDHCWKSSSLPENSFGRPRPFTSMRRSFFPNLSCREIVDRSCCFSESRFCGHLSSECEHLLLQLCHNLPHRHRHRSSTQFPDIKLLSCSGFHEKTAPRFAYRFHQTRQRHWTKHSPPESTTPKLSTAGQLPPPKDNKEQATQTTATMMKQDDFVSCDVDRFLEPFMRSVRQCRMK